MQLVCVFIRCCGTRLTIKKIRLVLTVLDITNARFQKRLFFTEKMETSAEVIWMLVSYFFLNVDIILIMKNLGEGYNYVISDIGMSH